MKTIAFIVAAFYCAAALAHAQLDHAEPAVGATVAAPSAVKIFFTEEINPGVSVIEVYDADGKEVDKKDSGLDPKDATILSVSLGKLGAGTYKVQWHVECCDNHKTKGDFKFEVK